MKKRLLLLLLCLLLSAFCTSAQAELKRYNAQFFGLFDTLTIIVGCDESSEAFRERAQRIHDELEIYHQLYDVYHEYEGINNLKTINDRAGEEPVQVDRRIIDLLLFCREMAQVTDGLVDITAGSVLKLWHDARTEGVDDPFSARLPDDDALRKAAEHTGFDCLVIDPEACTVMITDPEMQLNVGAIGKGYAVEQTARRMEDGMMLSVGGNVRVTGVNPITGAFWTAGVQDPDGEANEYLEIVHLDGVSIVTSGDYQRYYTVDGVRYGHIIDPRTLYPASLWRAVCILAADSGVADALSTALFMLPVQEGQRLLDHFGAHAMWIAADGSCCFSPGFEQYLKQ